MHHRHRKGEDGATRQQRATAALRGLASQVLAAVMAGLFVYIMFLSAAGH